MDPLTCPKCQGRIKIIAFIEDEEVIEKILKHLGLWDVKARPPPRVKTPSVTIHFDYSDSQVSSPDCILTVLLGIGSVCYLRRRRLAI